MARKIEEFDVIRLTVPLEGPNVFDDKDIYKLPIGKTGTVVHVFQGGKGFEVEFLIYPDPKDPDYFVSVQIPVEANQCELSCNPQLVKNAS